MVLEQASPLVLTNREGEQITLDSSELHDTGHCTQITQQQLDEDDVTWSATFNGMTPYGQVTVEVSYLLGVNRPEIENVEVTRLPHGLKVETIPTFSIHEDEPGEYDY